MPNFSKKTKGTVLVVLFCFLVIVLPGRYVLPKIPVLGAHFTSFYKYMDGFLLFGNKPWRDGGVGAFLIDPETSECLRGYAACVAPTKRGRPPS